MGKLIDDEILNTFAVVGAARAGRPRAAPPLRRRGHRISFYAPYKSDPDRWAQVLDDIKAA